MDAAIHTIATVMLQVIIAIPFVAILTLWFNSVIEIFDSNNRLNPTRRELLALAISVILVVIAITFFWVTF